MYWLRHSVQPGLRLNPGSVKVKPATFSAGIPARLSLRAGIVCANPHPAVTPRFETGPQLRLEETSFPSESETFRNIGILNDYVRIPYATGSVFAAQFLHAQFEQRGHNVTLIGPKDPNGRAEELPERSVLLKSLPFRSHPGFYLPIPTRRGFSDLAAQDFDVLLSQTGSMLTEAGVWLRAKKGVPLLNVNTAMLNRIYDIILPEALSTNERVQQICNESLVPMAESLSVRAYNNGDGLIVLSEGLVDYWRNLGVRVPIHVIPRPVNPEVRAGAVGDDPFSPMAPRGGRLLLLCRQVREKNVGRLIDIFADHIAPHAPNTTLTIVGDGPDRDAFKARAQRSGVGDRTFFPGEFPVSEVRNWYAHADLFLYGSLSETYGQVVSEAMYCGLPVVAFDDQAGVAQQVASGRDGILLPHGPNREVCNERYGAEVVKLMREPARRRRMADMAQRAAAGRSDPANVIDRYYDAFESAKRHRALCKPSASTAALAARWLAVHAFVASTGLLRPPAELNRRQAAAPRWGSIPSEPVLVPDAVELSGGEAA